LIDHLLEDDGGPEPADLSGEERMDLTEVMKQQIHPQDRRGADRGRFATAQRLPQNLTEVQSMILQRILGPDRATSGGDRAHVAADLVFNTIAVFVTLGFVIQDGWNRTSSQITPH